MGAPNPGATKTWADAGAGAAADAAPIRPRAAIVILIARILLTRLVSAIGVSAIGRFFCQIADQRECHSLVSATHRRTVPVHPGSETSPGGTPRCHRGL